MQPATANPSVLLREDFEDWAVLFDADSGLTLGINPTGVAVWKLLDGTRSVEEIATGLRDSFASVTDSVEEEVGRFVQSLVREGFAGFEVRERSVMAPDA